MTPVIGNSDFSGGLNVRDLGHLIAPNEATLAEGVNIEFKSVRTMDGDRRVLIDPTAYPEIGGIPGTAGGTPNNEPILGCWRYYYGMGFQHNAWVRVHGTTVEMWANGAGDVAQPEYQVWTAIGAAWPNGVVPNAVQFENTIYIMHGDTATGYTAKYVFWNGAAWQYGDAPVPGAPLANLRPTFGVAYKNRLYAVDQALEPFRLRYSGVNLPNQWNAPQGGYVTKGEDKGDPITGLFVHKDVLYVFRRSSVWRYWVDELGYEHIGQLHGAAGCIAHRSICAYKDAVYYASDEGMISIYGADSDCVTHKISREIEADPNYIQFTNAAVNAYTGTLYVSYLNEATVEQDLDDCGAPVGDPYCVYNTDTWRADIRRPNIINPRWVKLPYYRITCFATPPQSNVYKGSDYQQLRFCAQQPDVNEWNPAPAVTPDPLYLTGINGGPRHWNYIMGDGFDRDQVPAYDDPCGCLLYAGDEGIGFWLSFRTPRYLPTGNLYRLLWGRLRLDYYVWKNGVLHQGLDAGWMQIWIDDNLLLPTTNTFPLQPSWWLIDDETDSLWGGAAHREYILSRQSPTPKGRSIQMQWSICGTADRAQPSHCAEFRFWGLEYDAPEQQANVED